MSYNYTQIKKVGQWEVSIDPAASYGYFEHYIEGEGGGLWFEVSATSTPGDSGRVLDLIDFDGRACLPKKVAQAIRELGHIVGPDFE